jgi:hypothetical protein
MTTLSEWEGFAAAHRGSVVAWINQAEAASIVEHKIGPGFYSTQPIGIFALFLSELGLDETTSDQERTNARTDYPGKLIPDKQSDDSCVIFRLGGGRAAVRIKC